MQSFEMIRSTILMIVIRLRSIPWPKDKSCAQTRDKRLYLCHLLRKDVRRNGSIVMNVENQWNWLKQRKWRVSFVDNSQSDSWNWPTRDDEVNFVLSAPMSQERRWAWTMDIDWRTSKQTVVLLLLVAPLRVVLHRLHRTRVISSLKHRR